MKLLFLGTGTSHGIPVIGCTCPTCRSIDPRNNRMRCSAVIYGNSNETILIDCSPEFRLQALRSHLSKVDAVLVTHSHADHLHGLDDLRIFSKEQSLPLYANTQTLVDIQNRFDYVFKETQLGGGKPHFELKEACNPFSIGSVAITPVPILHGNLLVCGWVFGKTAYLTDCSHISESSVALLQNIGITTLIVDALRVRPHDTHYNFSQALDLIAKIQPKRAFFTHICHDMTHHQIQHWIQCEKKNRTDIRTIDVSPAYDGLKINCD